MWYSLNCKAGNQSDCALNFFWKQPIPKAKENMRDGVVFLKVSTDIPAAMGISLSTNSVIPLLYWNLTGANIFGDFIKDRAVFITGQNVMLEHSRSPNISLLLRSWLTVFGLVTCWKACELSLEGIQNAFPWIIYSSEMSCHSRWFYLRSDQFLLGQEQMSQGFNTRSKGFVFPWPPAFKATEWVR